MFEERAQQAKSFSSKSRDEEVVEMHSIDFTKDLVGDRRTLFAVSELVRLCFAVRFSLNENCQ